MAMLVDLSSPSINTFGSPPEPSSRRLMVDEQVILVRDGSMERGIVRWIGHLPGHIDLMVGVEFENPIGSGCGGYQGRQLFTTRMNHAALVPMVGLVRAVDFDRQNDNYDTIRRNLLIDFDDDTSVTTSVSVSVENDTSVWSATPELKSSSSRVETVSPPGIHVGSSVEAVIYPSDVQPAIFSHGIVRWIGQLPDKTETMAGVELEQDLPYWVRFRCDGHYKGTNEFHCEYKRGVFVPLDTLRPDKRAGVGVHDLPSLHEAISSLENSQLPSPWKRQGIQLLVGKPKGIQGKGNSCYLDATLFALFATTDAFDNLLTRPRTPDDIRFYDDVRKCLFSIVEHLRKSGYVADDLMMKLRRFLHHALPEIVGFTSDEKDPEELIAILFGRVFQATPDVHLSTGQSSHICQLIVEDAFGKTALTSVQTLFDRSFFCSNVLLESMPDRLIVQLPRYGKQKLYDYIVPSLKLDLSYVLEHRARTCGHCGQLAQWHCKMCFFTVVVDYPMSFFCNSCCQKFHSLREIVGHEPTTIPTAVAPVSADQNCRLDLVAVICIESSHFVSYVRAQSESHTKWLFFNSMADREGGEITGHNVPEVVGCDDYFDLLLKQENRHHLVDALPLAVDSSGRCHGRLTSSPLPDFMERLLKDSYIVVYARLDK